MLFSVIIPTYNRRDLLKQALDSVHKQTFTDYEIIVVDDGSTDGTWEDLQAMAPAIRVQRQQNTGPGAARNLGARAASGAYLAFLDSDDLWFPWTLDAYRITLHKHSMPTMISGEGVSLQQYHTSIQAPIVEYKSQYFDCLLEACNGPMLPVGGTPSITLKRDTFIRHGGFVNDHLNGEDTDLWLRVGCEPGFVRLLAPPVFAQRVHANNVTDDCDRSLAGMRYIFKQEASGIYPGKLAQRRRRIDVLAATARTVSLRALRHNRLQEALCMYRQAIRWHVELGRWKYLLGFPAMVGLKYLRSKLACPQSPRKTQ